MKISKKLLLAISISMLLLGGCNGERAVEKVDELTITNNNYVEIAKSIYANPQKMPQALPPQATSNPDTIYINKIIRPRDYKITNIEAIQGDNILTIAVDNRYKYATITLNSGSSQKQQKVNLKDFTAEEK